MVVVLSYVRNKSPPESPRLPSRYPEIFPDRLHQTPRTQPSLCFPVVLCSSDHLRSPAYTSDHTNSAVYNGRVFSPNQASNQVFSSIPSLVTQFLKDRGVYSEVSEVRSSRGSHEFRRRLATSTSHLRGLKAGRMSTTGVGVFVSQLVLSHQCISAPHDLDHRPIVSVQDESSCLGCLKTTKVATPGTGQATSLNR
jgi:hypothetical protein